MSKSTTIVLAVSKEEFISSLEYVSQIARQAPVSADTHDKVRNNLALIVQGIQEKDLMQLVEDSISALQKAGDLIEFKDSQVDKAIDIAKRALKLSDK